jgi:hypothetical protein
MRIENIGLDLAVVGSGTSIVGVFYNNVLLRHTDAMLIWCVSNVLLMTFFYGQYKRWWDGGLSSEVVCVMYGIMLVSGIWGLLNV